MLRLRSHGLQCTAGPQHLADVVDEEKKHAYTSSGAPNGDLGRQQRNGGADPEQGRDREREHEHK